MATVHHFQYGWVGPVLAFVLSAPGCLLGLLFAARARATTGRQRFALLTGAAIAIGGPGIWLMHFIAILGFDVPDSDVRYEPGLTALSVLIVVVAVWLGLAVACRPRLSRPRLLLGGLLTGLGVVAMHYTGMAALRVGGGIGYDPKRVAASVVIAVVVATIALLFAVAVRGLRSALPAAATMAVAVAGLHYTAMSAVQVRLHVDHDQITGLNPIFLLMPIAVIGGAVIAVLAFFTFGHASVDAPVPPVVEEPRALPEGPAGVAPPAVPPRYPPAVARELAVVRATRADGRLRVRGPGG